MAYLRALVLGVSVWGALAPSAKADVAPFSFFRHGNPCLKKDDNPPPAEKPRKSAPGLCGTGAGLALAGIAAVWGVCWAGRRMRKS